MGDYFKWHADQCELMLFWSSVSPRIGSFRESCLDLADLLNGAEMGGTLNRWNKMLDASFCLLADIRSETGCWIEDRYRGK